MEQAFSEMLSGANDFAEIFELVKDAVEESLGRNRAGLMLGIAELGQFAQGFIGGYHEIDSNLIVLNSTPLRSIKQKKPELLKPYCFHVLLHEYIHSLGFLDEANVREITLRISEACFGKKHLVSLLAKNFEKFLPGIAYGNVNLIPKKEPTLFIVQGFDKGNLTYIS